MIIKIHNNRIDFLTDNASQASATTLPPSSSGETLSTCLPASFPMNTGVSVAANMREALKTTMRGEKTEAEQAEVFIDTPMVMVPEEQLQYEDAEALYRMTVTTTEEEGIVIMQKPIPELNVVAVYAVNRELKTVIEDNFSGYEFTQMALPCLMKRMKDGTKGMALYKTLWAYFNDKSMHIFAFDAMARLLFFNSFTAATPSDRAYLLLGVWKHLNLNQMKDKLRLMGDIPEKEALAAILHDFIQNYSLEGCE